MVAWVEGRVQADLDLTIPLAIPETMQADIQGRIEASRLYLDMLHLPLEDLTGDLPWQQICAQRLKAKRIHINRAMSSKVPPRWVKLLFPALSEQAGSEEADEERRVQEWEAWQRDLSQYQRTPEEEEAFHLAEAERYRNAPPNSAFGDSNEQQEQYHRNQAAMAAARRANNTPPNPFGSPNPFGAP